MEEVVEERVRPRRNTASLWNCDRLYNAGHINQDQHFALMHLRWWWDCIHRAALGSLSLETMHGNRVHFLHKEVDADRLDAQSMLAKISTAMHERGHNETMLLWAPCFWLAVDELSMERAIKKLGKRRTQGREQIDYALTCLYDELDGRKMLWSQRNENSA